MTKITLKTIIALLSLFMFSNVNAQLEGTYKFKNKLTGKYLTVDVANSNCISVDEIAGDSPTQIFTVLKATDSDNYNISCSVPEFDALRANSTNVFPTTTSTPTGNTNNTRIFTFQSDGDGAYDIITPQTSSTRYVYDDADTAVSPVADGNVIYIGSAANRTKWILESATLSTDYFDRNSVLISNPINDKLMVRSLKVELSKLEVYNLLGQRVISHQGSNTIEDSIEINTSFLSKGMYVVKIYDINNSILMSKKVVK